MKMLCEFNIIIFNGPAGSMYAPLHCPVLYCVGIPCPLDLTTKPTNTSIHNVDPFSKNGVFHFVRAIIRFRRNGPNHNLTFDAKVLTVGKKPGKR